MIDKQHGRSQGTGSSLSLKGNFASNKNLNSIKKLRVIENSSSLKKT